MNHYKNKDVLDIPGYEIWFTRYADCILKDQFQTALKELEDALNSFHIREEQVIKGGGGKSKISQAFSKLISRWKKETIKSELHIEDKLVSRQVFELDHYKSFSERGKIGLKMQWNSKDPVFDSNLEDFRKLHQAGALSIGVMVTRGESLQRELFHVYQRFLENRLPLKIEELQTPLGLSQNARKEIKEMIEAKGDKAVSAIADHMHTSKFGSATTHMGKLFERIDARIGDPCPLILIGIGKDRLQP
jgi:hypothetical protein